MGSPLWGKLSDRLAPAFRGQDHIGLKTSKLTIPSILLSLKSYNTMTLAIPSKEEASKLLVDPDTFRGLPVCADALPPAILLTRAIAAGGNWCMPRLFSEDSAGRIVGSAGFKTLPQEGRVEIGYGISPACRRQGYATAGVGLLVQEAFDSGLIHEVYAEVSVSNEASRGVVRKLGFVYQRIVPTDEGDMEIWSRKNPDLPQDPAAPSIKSPVPA